MRNDERRELLHDEQTLWRDLPAAIGSARRIDRVELKVVLPNRYAARLLAALAPAHANQRRIYYLDTPALRLYRHGLVLRARRTEGGRGDLALKLRGPGAPSTSARRLRLRQLHVELDALPDSMLWSLSVTQPRRWSALRPIIDRDRSWCRVLTAGQRALLERTLGAVPKAVQSFGPVLAARYSGGGTPFALELWRYPDQSRLLELSVKCPPAGAARRSDQLSALLRELDITVPAAQTTKTAKTLAYPCARRLKRLD
jgi:hypothetical protein